MDAPKDIEKMLIALMCPYGKLKLSFTCKRYRQMFGTLREFLNVNVHNFDILKTFMRGNYKKVQNDKYNYDISQIFYTCWIDTPQQISAKFSYTKYKIFYKGHEVYSHVPGAVRLLYFDKKIFLVELGAHGKIFIISKKGLINKIKTNTFIRAKFIRHMDDFIIVQNCMIFADCKYYIDARYKSLISVKDKLIWHNCDYVYIRHIP